MKSAGSDKERNASCGTMPSPPADVMDTSSQYSSCETLDSHRSSEFDEKNEVNGNDNQRPRRKVRKIQLRTGRINDRCRRSGLR